MTRSGRGAVRGADARYTAAVVPPVAPLVGLWALCVVGFVMPTLLGAPGSRSLEFVRQVAFLAPFVAFSLTATRVAAAVMAEERVLWRGLAVGATLVTLGESMVSARIVASGPQAWDSVALVLSVTASLVLIVTLALLADIRAFGRMTRVRHAIDLVGGALVVGGTVFWAVTSRFPEQLAGADEALPMGVIAAGYSALGAVMLTLVLFSFARRRSSSWPAWERRVAVGIGVYALATLLWPAWLHAAYLAPGSLVDTLVEVGWMTGMSVAFSGALMRMRAADGAAVFSALPRLQERRSILSTALGPIVFLLSVGGFGALAAQAVSGSADRVVYAALAVLLAGVTVARTLVITVEAEQFLADAILDPVTGIQSHRYFQERLQLELDLARRHGDSLAVAMLDIDDFQLLNDAYGHSYGDTVLRLVASALTGSLTENAVVCRLGGDQFGAVLPRTDALRAPDIASQMRAAIAALRWPDSSPVTASVGVALFPEHGADRTTIVRAAERACMWAKCRGKDRTALYEAATVEALPCEERVTAITDRSHLAAVRALVSVVDAREPHAGHHSRNVATLARLLGAELGFDERRLELLETAAFLHDVGKIGVTDEVILKRGSLSAEESRRVREHAALGERIVSFTGVEEILPWIRHHHERFDGTGYPDGVAGSAIPLESRVIAVCDAFEVMTSGTLKRPALSLTAALQEIDLCMGTQFDPEVAEAFIRVVSARRPLLATS